MNSIKINEFNKIRSMLPDVFTKDDIAEIIHDKKAPKKYIERLATQGILTRIKLNTYAFTEDADLLAIANGLVDYSYLSFESALAHYGMIPERVSLIMSVTASDRPREYKTPIGQFVYLKQNSNLFSAGMSSEIRPSGRRVLVASREKAVCDTLYRSKMPFSKMSISEFADFLFNGLRIEEEAIKQLRIMQISSFIPYYRTKGPQLLSELLERSDLW